MIQNFIHYEQLSSGNSAPPCDYYDPHHMLAEKNYSIKPHEEILLIIRGHGYRFNDDTIYPLEIVRRRGGEEKKLMETTTTTNTTTGDTGGDNNNNNNHDDDDDDADKRNVVPAAHSTRQLCVFIKNFSDEFTIYVGSNSSLAWLLDCSKIYSKLCYCDAIDLNATKQIINKNMTLKDETNCGKVAKYQADDETICLHK